MDDKIYTIVDSFQKGDLKIKSGTLKFWGEWFGRPMDNYHAIKKLEIYLDKDILILKIQFDQEEVLSIWNPIGMIVDDKHFIIKEAEKLRWEWYSYGYTKNNNNLYFIEFKRENNKLVRLSGRVIQDNCIKKTIDIPKDHACEIC